MYPEGDIYADKNNRPAVGTRVHFIDSSGHVDLHYWGIIENYTKRYGIIRRFKNTYEEIQRISAGIIDINIFKPTDELTEDLLHMYWSKPNNCWMINYNSEQCPVYGYIQ